MTTTCELAVHFYYFMRSNKLPVMRQRKPANSDEQCHQVTIKVKDIGSVFIMNNHIQSKTFVFYTL